MCRRASDCVGLEIAQRPCCRDDIFWQKEGLSAEMASFCSLFACYWKILPTKRGFLGLQKASISAERLSFGRKNLFRFFLYFCRNKFHWEALFLLSAERKDSSFGCLLGTSSSTILPQCFIICVDLWIQEDSHKMWYRICYDSVLLWGRCVPNSIPIFPDSDTST